MAFYHAHLPWRFSRSHSVASHRVALTKFGERCGEGRVPPMDYQLRRSGPGAPPQPEHLGCFGCRVVLHHGEDLVGGGKVNDVQALVSGAFRVLDWFEVNADRHVEAARSVRHGSLAKSTWRRALSTQ